MPCSPAGVGFATRGGCTSVSAFLLSVLALWLQRLQENLPELWRLRGGRILAEDTELLQQLTQLVWDNAETPVRLECAPPAPP